MIFDSSEIFSGQTPLNPDEKAALIPGHIQLVSELNQFESQNILQAERKYLQGRRKVWPLEDPEFLKKVHRTMFDATWDWAGQFRRSDKNLGIEWFRIPEEMKKICGDFKYWKENRPYSTTEIAVRFHHRLVSIHPFPNGNGRHARLIADIFLREAGEEFFTWGSGELLENAPDRNVYTSALKNADKEDYSELIRFARS
jgi:Fic-DOC domain mobile mystery protein B